MINQEYPEFDKKNLLGKNYHIHHQEMFHYYQLYSFHKTPFEYHLGWSVIKNYRLTKKYKIICSITLCQ